MLQVHIEPFIEEHYPEGYIFQQDSAPADKSKMTRDYFMDSEITNMEWPAKSPDLNCIENQWGTLSQCL